MAESFKKNRTHIYIRELLDCFSVDIRLVGGTSSREGRVEVKVGNTWGLCVMTAGTKMTHVWFVECWGTPQGTFYITHNKGLMDHIAHLRNHFKSRNIYDYTITFIMEKRAFSHFFQN